MDRSNNSKQRPNKKETKLKLVRKKHSNNTASIDKQYFNPYKTWKNRESAFANKLNTNHNLDRSISGLNTVSDGLAVAKEINIVIEKPLPENPYKKSQELVKVVRIKSILRTGSNSHWWLTNESRTLNYSKSFNGPTCKGEKLLLRWKADNSKKVTWIQNQIYYYTPTKKFDPWENSYKKDSLVRCLKPYKF